MVSLRRGLVSPFGFLLLAVLFVCTSAVNAQQVFGRIFGTVTDATGGAIPNAKVTITDQDKGTQSVVESNESGNYEKGQLIPGKYQVEVEATGFAKQQFKDIQVLVNTAPRVDATLQPGNVTETVEVTAAAPTLQADRADVQTSFTSQQLIDLPSLGRNAQNYELLAPGTNRIGFAHASSEDPQGSAQIQVNGQHFSSTGYDLDGTVNQDPILGIVVINSNIDSLGEQKIITQTYDAEFGYVAAGMVNSSTKSGTNDLHFSAFEYLRNNSPGFYDFGRDPFAEKNTPAGTFKFNQFGGSFGGKIIKDKLFYFADTELIRQSFVGTVQTTVPTALARQGNFSEYLAANSANQIYDPASGNQSNGTGRTPFANNIIPTNRLSPQALNILQYFPLPNAAQSDPLLPNYTASGAGTRKANKWDVRSDYFMNQKTSIFGRYSNHQFEQSAPGAFGSLAGGPAFNNVVFAGNSFSRDQSIAIGVTHSVNPSLINEFRFGYMKYYVQTTPNGVGTAPATAAGIPGLNVDNFYTSGLPYFRFLDASGNNPITGLGYALGVNSCNCPLTESESQYQFTDNLTKIAGNHTMKFGADIRYAKNLRVPSDTHRAGELTFNTNNTGNVTTVGGSPQGGLSFATFLLGDVTAFGRYVSSSTNAAEHQRRWFFYGQDSWRVTSKLTVNWGLRWELVFPEEVNGAGNGAQLDLRTGLINVFGVGNVSVHGIQSMNYANLAPRLGIAYQLNPKTVIRTGYGWSYGLGTFGATFGHNVTQNPPVLSPQNNTAATAFSSVFNLAQGPPPPPAITVPVSGQFLLPNNVSGKARPLDVRLPRAEAYNFTVERQLDQATSLSIGYVGNVGRHVAPGSGNGYDINVNQAAWIPGVSSQDVRKPFFGKYGWTQSISLYCMCNTNYYNSLQVQLKRSFKGGYATQISYTFQDGVADQADAYSFLYNRPLGRGRMDSIPDHGLTIAQNFNIPFGRGRKFGSNMNHWLDAVVGGWNLAGVTTFYSGLPFTPNLTNISNRPDVGAGGRPNVGTGSPYAANQSRDQWLNVGPGNTPSSAFAIPAANTYGNYAYNALRGPIFINQDVNLSKDFHITEKLRWQIRAEGYNIFNHANLGLPNSNVNGSAAGTITAIAFGSQMRRLQFGTRFDF